MTGEGVLETRFERERARRAAARVRRTANPSTPQQRLLRAAETGQFETVVGQAQPAEPPRMVTPEEREAELRAAGKLDPPKPAPPPPPSEPKEPEHEPTPGEQYIAERCRWRHRGPGDGHEPAREGRCLTEYDPLAADDDYEDDEW
jgi:hypothetical protein